MPTSRHALLEQKVAPTPKPNVNITFAINTLRIGYHEHLRTAFLFHQNTKKYACQPWLIFMAQILPPATSQDSRRFERSPRKPGILKLRNILEVQHVCQNSATIPEANIRLMEEILHHLRLVVYPIIHRVLSISGGAGFLPSTVAPANWWL